MAWTGNWDGLSGGVTVQTVVVTQKVASGPSSPSKTSICNMAIAHTGESAFISNVDTDRSKEAILCRRFYDQAVAYVLRGFNWPFATKYRALPLVQATPNNDWGFAYRYPTDAVYIRRIVTALGKSDPNLPAFVVGQDDQGQLVYTDEPDVTVEYTTRIDDPQRFDAQFVETVAWKIAADIAPGLSRVKNIAQDALKMMALHMAQAQINVANEQERTPERESEFVRARE